MEMFYHGFMQRAFVAGTLVAVVAPIVGMLLLLRRQALFADTLSHISLAGVALGAVLGWNPTATAGAVAVIGALAMEQLRRTYRTYSELSIAIVMTTGLALALVLVNVNQGLNFRLQAYLFGSIVAVRPSELIMIALVTLCALLFVFGAYRSLYCLTFDEDTARVGGIATQAISYVFSVITGILVAVAMPIIGVLLVSAIIVLPPALAIRLVKGFRQALIVAVGVSVIGMWGGLTTSYYYEVPPGATIALILVLFLLIGLGGKASYRRWVSVSRRRVARHTHTSATDLVEPSVRSESKSAGEGQADRS